MCKVYYIDPQSYNNLSMYDHSLLSAVKGHEIVYYHNDLYQLPEMPQATCRNIFHYCHYSLGALKGLSYLWSVIRILYDAWRERPDVVHIQWIRLWKLDYWAAKILKKLGCRLVFTAHNILPHVRKKGDEVRYKQYYEIVDKIIVHTSRTRQELADMLQVDLGKIEVIFHGAMKSDVPDDLVERKAHELMQQLHIAPDTIVFSSLGVQKPYKGTEEIIKVWSSTPELRDNPKCKLLIMGRCHHIDYTPIASLPNVVAEDRMLSDEEFEAYLRLSSVVLLTYRVISQSGLLFSCVNRKVPVLISDVGGLPETLGFGNIGWNIGRLSVESLRNGMLRLATHPEEIAAVRANKAGFDKIKEVYSWSTIGEHTSALYRSFH